MRKLAMLLTLCLLAGMLPGAAFAEGVEPYIEEYVEESAEAEVPPEAVGFVGAEGLYAVPEGDSDEDWEEEWEEEALPDGDAAVEAPDPAPAELIDPAMAGEQAVEAAPHTDPNGPALAANQVTLGVGETFALNAVMPAGRECAISYLSTDPAVASVDGGGVITAAAPGDITVAATAEDGTYAECFASVRKAPDAVAFTQPKFELGKGEVSTALGVVLGSAPGDFAGGYTLTSSKKKVVAVEPGGALRALKTGKSVVTVQTYNGLTAKCAVTVRSAPKKVTLALDKTEMGLGETGQATYTLPKKTAGQVSFVSENPGVVAVDPVTGAMTAVGLGVARIRVTTFNGKTSAADVTVKAAPAALTFGSDEFLMGVGMTVASAAYVNEGAAAGIVYQLGNTAVAKYEKGVLKAVAPGETTLTASTYNGLTASCKLVVKPKPKSVHLPYTTLTITVGDSVLLTPDVGDSASTFTYSTSAKKRVSVTPDGVITGLAKGKATITVKTYNKKKCKLKVVVEEKPPIPGNPDTELPVDVAAVTTVIPARTTDIAGIPANLQKIDALRLSAIGRIDAMRAAGIINDADAAKRASIVNNAFADYAFPWMTPAYQAYWKKANSDGGLKDFQPDRVYYGLPYISGSNNNRLYNAKRALSEGRYTTSGSGYYLLNQKNLLGKKYVGNDCSGFVDAAIWGSGVTTDRTTEIAKNKKYRTIDDYGCLRTGDLICKSGAHVVMFLYFTAADKSQMMVIENGGIEPGVNTVHCMIMDTAYYQIKGYLVRRLATLG